MSDQPDSPVPYRVSYFERVRQETRQLIARARTVGLEQQVLAAVKQIDYLLRKYPQFGQPLRNLALQPAQVWMGTVAPLVVHYYLDEERRLVIVATPFLTLSKSGL